MSTGPPKPAAGISFGSPLAKVVVAPVLGSTRVILPAALSVTYSARSGPMVLPEPPCRPVTKRCAIGARSVAWRLRSAHPTRAARARGEQAIRTVVASSLGLLRTVYRVHVQQAKGSVLASHHQRGREEQHCDGQ